MKDITKDKNIHAGHRDRLRAKFLNGGYQALADHEILELMLFYVVPRKDTNAMAHALIRKYGSLSAVLNTPVRELESEKNITHTGAVLLQMLGRSAELSVKLSQNRTIIGSPSDVFDVVAPLLAGKGTEDMVVICLDERNKVIRHFVVAGSVSDVAIKNRELLQRLLDSNAKSVVIAHNHPSGDPQPSEADRVSTLALAALLKRIEINLYDHVIVTDNRCFSFVMNHLLER